MLQLPVHISRYNFPKSPKSYQIQPFAVMLAWWNFIIAKVMKFLPMFHVQQQQDTQICAILRTQKHCFKVKSYA